ncbi:hypothetical protein CY34DRAFT_206872 [Suillus luteus UH-Slu-Lm8-n1]|uniref:Uncharacterized protein n=1 Tax=Suillus luteus UH-Slu-Lm8-n1 TaxID=930992 RepID=A0A0D0B4I9_9AGAM|nr:hypothetical protein CY34DRAFT_206872 [Suillus luteus UH-Slu-Lm8-n1]
MLLGAVAVVENTNSSLPLKISLTLNYLYRGSCWIPSRHHGMDSARSQAMNHSCLHVAASRNSSMHTHVPSSVRKYQNHCQTCQTLAVS